MIKAVYPGTFDPLTRGHEDLVRRASTIFGTLIVGVAAPAPWIWAAGVAFHLLNGIAFAMAYAEFLGTTAARSVRWALVTGMLWGVGLETFQLVIFPGWLSIGFVAEFATISFASHLVYGATLATVVRRRELAARLRPSNVHAMGDGADTRI